MSFLTDAADAMLAASRAEPATFHTRYHQCLWTVVAAPAHELQQLAKQVWQEPYGNLPVPLLVAVLRLAGLESLGDAGAVSSAINNIAAFCDPEEEAGATGSLQEWLDEHRNQQP